MALEAQVVPITLKNLNQKGTRSGKASGILDVCRNVIYTKGDEDGLEGHKRFGLTSQPADTYTGSIGEVLQIWGVGETLYQSAINGIWGLANGRWALSSTQPPGIISAEAKGVGPSYVQCTDGSTTTDGFEIVAWQNLHGTGGRSVYVHLSHNGQIIEANRLISADGIRPKVVTTFNGTNDVLVVFWMDPIVSPGFCVVYAKIYDPLARTWSADIATMSVAPLAAPGPGVVNTWFDVKRSSTNDIMVAGPVAATGLLRTTRVSPAGLSGPTVNSAFAVTTSGSIATANYLGFAYVVAVNTDTTFKLIKLDATTRADVAENPGAAGVVLGNCTGVVFDTNGLLYMVAEAPNAKATRYNIWRRVINPTTMVTVDGSRLLRLGLGLASKAVVFRGKPVFMAAYTEVYPQGGATPTQANALTTTCNYLITMDDGTVISKANQNTAGGIEWMTVSDVDFTNSMSSTLPQALIVDGGTMRIVTKRLAVPVSSFGFIDQYRQPVRLTFTLGETSPPLDFGRSRFVLGGNPQTFDSTDLAGPFLTRPPKLVVAAIPVAGFLGVGDYAYHAVYAWADSLGQIHRSGASDIATVTTVPGSQQVSIVVETYRLVSLEWLIARPANTNLANAWIEIYRTAVNGDFPRLILNMDPPPLNDPQVTTVTLTDNVSDTVQASGTPLYTTTGELNHVPPPPSRVGCIWQNRAILASLDRQGVLAISNDKLEGGGITFGAGVEYILPGEPEVRGMLAMGQSLAVWTDKEIFLLAGSLPNLKGEGLNITWTRVPTQNSCLGPMQLALTTDGALFKTGAGFYMLGLGGGLDYVGAPVEDSNALTTKAVFAGNDETRVYCVHLDGETLVYDTYWKSWSTFDGHEAQGGCAFGSRYALSIGLVPGSTKVRNDAYDDDGVFVSSRYRFSDFEFSGVEGFACAWQAIVLGEYVGPHILNVDVIYDLRQPAAVAEHFEDATSPYFPTGYSTTPYASDFYAGAPGADGVYQFPFMLRDPYCMAAMVEVYDTEETGLGPSGGFTLTDLCWEVGSIPRSNRISPQKRLSPR